MRKAKALEGIGIQRHPDDFELFKTELFNTNNNPFVHLAALKSISKYRTLEAHKLLFDRVNYGVGTDESRYVAILCLADITQWQSEIVRVETIEKLHQILRSEPLEHIRKVIVESLVSLESRASYDIIAAMQRTFSNKESAWIYQKLQALRTSSTPVDSAAGARYQRQLEELETKYKRLEEKLANLTPKEPTKTT